MNLDPNSLDLLRRLLDAMPTALFLVDEDLSIAFHNAAATPLVSYARTQVLHRRTGEALHCLNAQESLGGCGKTKACQTCIIRGSINEAFETGQRVSRRSKMIRAEGNGMTKDLFLHVTASPFDFQGHRLVLLALEDISPIMEMQRLIPICSKCHKVRTDQDYWTKLEEYARDNLGADFTHGYCPDCFKIEMDALEKRKSTSGRKPIS